ncbi:MAG: hypothetical protein ACK2TT_03045 [Anaerolineales bacterium]|jgi:hypothetical protein
MKTIRWIARIWSVPLILYALVVLIGTAATWLGLGTPDPYAVQEQQTTAEYLTPVLLSLSALGLALAWRWELPGSLLSLACLAAALISLLVQVPLDSLTWATSTPYWLCLAALLPAAFFLLDALRGRAGDKTSTP